MSFSVCSRNRCLARFLAVSLCLQTRLVLGNSRTRCGGARRWLEFRIVFESAGLFHGEVINAGSRCHKLSSLSRCHVRHGGFVPWRIEPFDFAQDRLRETSLAIPLTQNRSEIDPRFFSRVCGIRMTVEMTTRTMKWICCQLGAREHYAIPRALFRLGMLDYLLTDAWVPPSSLLAKICGRGQSSERGFTMSCATRA